jgi:hypothetical protein
MICNRDSAIAANVKLDINVLIACVDATSLQANDPYNQYEFIYKYNVVGAVTQHNSRSLHARCNINIVCVLRNARLLITANIVITFVHTPIVIIVPYDTCWTTLCSIHSDLPSQIVSTHCCQNIRLHEYYIHIEYRRTNPCHMLFRSC